MSSDSETEIILYQLEVTEEMHTFVNGPNGGWDNAAKKYPAWNAHLEVTGITGGSKKWKTEYFEFYRPVAKLATDDLEEAFGIGNAYGGAHSDMVERGLLEPLLPMIEMRNGHITPNMHSMSIGDICKKGDEYFMCDPTGFGLIEVTEHVGISIESEYNKERTANILCQPSSQ
tara:strand:+ start:951 stop:1469 length:519 start_codon:yes stop_codon:yes gene_type:complete